MADFLQTSFELMTQLTGEGGRQYPNILRDSLEALFWLGLLVISRLKYKDTPEPYTRLLSLGFATAGFGALFLLSVILMGIFSVFAKETLHILFPPIVHSLSDFADFVIAGAYMHFLTGRQRLSTRFLKFSLSSVGVVYLSTFIWWGRHIYANPGSTFSATWCDWVFRINACFWLGLAISILWKNAMGWSRYWVVAAVSLLFLDDFGKIVDMSLGNVYKPYINPFRSLIHLIAVLLFGYIFVREQASGIKAAFDSLEDTVEDRTVDLKEARDRLEHSLEQQIRFTADASHELRTPLTLILNEVHWALNRERSLENYQTSMKTCEVAAKHMKELLESLLQLARGDSGYENISKKKTDLKSMCEESLVVLEAIGQPKEISVNFSAREEKLESEVDEAKILQILINLVSNSVRYSPKNSVVNLSLERSDGWGVITVSDEGRGISKDDLPHIFDRFYRADKARADASEGVGLGLSVCLALAQAHDGELTVSSDGERGTSFCLKLPLGENLNR